MERLTSPKIYCWRPIPETDMDEIKDTAGGNWPQSAADNRCSPETIKPMPLVTEGRKYMLSNTEPLPPPTPSETWIHLITPPPPKIRTHTWLNQPTTPTDTNDPDANTKNMPWTSKNWSNNQPKPLNITTQIKITNQCQDANRTALLFPLKIETPLKPIWLSPEAQAGRIYEPRLAGKMGIQRDQGEGKNIIFAEGNGGR